MSKLCAFISLRFSAVTGSILVLWLLIIGSGSASAPDLHWLWDNQCAECHGHSAEFARKFLKVSSNQLQGKHHVYNLRDFMRNHYMPDTEVDAVYEMLRAQVLTRPRFKQECSSCHGSAAQFVRHSIVLKGQELLVQNSAQPVQEFLRHHRQLDSDDVNFYTRLLGRLAHEVFRP